MLRQRLLTSSLLVPLLVWEILYVGAEGLAVVAAIFITLAAWEWAQICGWHTQRSRWLYATAIAVCLVLTYLAKWWLPYTTLIVLTFACIWWLVGLRWVWLFQYDGIPRLPTQPSIKALFGVFILVPPALAFYVLHHRLGGEWVVFFLVLIWAADSGAYFAGRYWGQQKLAPRISPGKTWEGVLGAIGITVLVASSYAYFWSAELRTAEWWLLSGFMALCLITVLVSILGDLLESLFKRQVGLKDSSDMLPGHGGILDRIDSLTAAAPIFVLGIIPLLNQSLLY